MHKKWKNLESQQKSLLQKMKNTKGVGEFFSDLPEKGEMRDNISKNKVKIVDGPFIGMNGKVESIDVENKMLIL